MRESCRSKVMPLLEIMNDSEIAKEVGVSRERIRQIRFPTGIISPHYHQSCSRVMNEEKLGKAIELFKQNKTSIEISNELNISRYTLYVYMRKVGYKFTGGPPKKVSDEQIKQAIKDRWTYQQMVKEWHVHLQTVYRRIKKMHLTIFVPDARRKNVRTPHN